MNVSRRIAFWYHVLLDLFLATPAVSSDLGEIYGVQFVVGKLMRIYINQILVVWNKYGRVLSFLYMYVVRQSWVYFE